MSFSDRASVFLASIKDTPATGNLMAKIVGSISKAPCILMLNGKVLYDFTQIITETGDVTAAIQRGTNNLIVSYAGKFVTTVKNDEFTLHVLGKLIISMRRFGLNNEEYDACLCLVADYLRTVSHPVRMIDGNITFIERLACEGVNRATIVSALALYRDTEVTNRETLGEKIVEFLTAFSKAKKEGNFYSAAALDGTGICKVDASAAHPHLNLMAGMLLGGKWNIPGFGPECAAELVKIGDFPADFIKQLRDF